MGSAAITALTCAALLVLPAYASAQGSAVGSLARGAGNDLVLTVHNTGTLTIASIAFTPPSLGFRLTAPRPSSCVTQPDDEDLPGNVICGSGGIGAPPTNLIPPGGTFTVTVAVSPRYPDGAGGDLFFTTNDAGVLESSDVAVAGPAAPAPVVGRLVTAAPLRGNVFISLAAAKASAAAFTGHATATAPSVPGLKGRRFVALRDAGQIPVRSLLDTRKGTVKLTSARSTHGGTLTADFRGGVFQILQSGKAKARGLTELRLKGASFKACRSSRSNAATKAPGARAARRRVIRRLRGSGRGRFRIRGRYSAATVRGTDWTVTDRCDGTLTTVKRGKVAVRDFRRKRTVTVRAGRSYLARK